MVPFARPPVYPIVIPSIHPLARPSTRPSALIAIIIVVSISSERLHMLGLAAMGCGVGTPLHRGWGWMEGWMDGGTDRWIGGGMDE